MVVDWGTVAGRNADAGGGKFSEGVGSGHDRHLRRLRQGRQHHARRLRRVVARHGDAHPPWRQGPDAESYTEAGSGWGGYPPAEDERAWQQICRHAEWLGLDWNRVEIEQRIYEPERNKFTFDSPEMRILYRILDWNQRKGADVFFQQMWCNAAWLAYPEFHDDPARRVHSAPTDMDAFADGLATLMEHLLKKRGYTCIKWLCINNEPGAGFSWWQAPGNKPLSIGPGVAAVRKALDKRGLKLPLSGPDFTNGFLDKPSGIDYLGLLGAYDFHDYGADFDFRTGATSWPRSVAPQPG